MSYYRPLTVDHTKVPSTQTDFPVLVSLSDATLKTVANGGHVQRSDGFDIGFYSDSGLTTKLKWEIESYDPVNGIVVAWVKVASLSSSSDYVFYMGYGDTAITTDQSDPANVWTNSFLGVYHLGNGTTLAVNSSTGSNNGTNHGATATTGKVDGGGSFVAASTQYVDLGTGMNPSNLTYSAWVKATSYPSPSGSVIARHNATVFSILRIDSAGKLSPAFLSASGNVPYGTATITMSTGTWYYVVATYDHHVPTGLVTGYVNAAVDATSGATTAVLDTTVIATNIGRDANNAGREWNGLLDEVRIASVPRSADWITTEYNNQNAPGSFLTFGTEVSSSADVTVNLTGVSASPAVGVLGFNGSLPLVGVAATPVIGTGTVQFSGDVSVSLVGVSDAPVIGTGTVAIEGEVIAPPVSPGGGTGARTGMRIRPTEDKAVYLKGVEANPKIGQVMVLHEMQRVYEKYSAPIPRTQKPAEMPPGMRRLFKPVEKPVPPPVFVYPTPFPKLRSAVGRMTVKATFEDIDEELIAMIDLL